MRGDLDEGGRDCRFRGELAEPDGGERELVTLAVEIEAGRPANVVVEVEAPR